MSNLEPAVRDEEGYCTHPAITNYLREHRIEDEETYIDLRDIKEFKGYDIKQVAFEFDAPEEVSKRYYEHGWTDISGWTPTPPSDDAVLIDVMDVEGGPIAYFAVPMPEIERLVRDFDGKDIESLVLRLKKEYGGRIPVETLGEMAAAFFLKNVGKEDCFVGYTSGDKSTYERFDRAVRYHLSQAWKESAEVRDKLKVVVSGGIICRWNYPDNAGGCIKKIELKPYPVGREESLAGYCMNHLLWIVDCPEQVSDRALQIITGTCTQSDNHVISNHALEASDG